MAPLLDRPPVVDAYLRDDESTRIHIARAGGELRADVLRGVVENRVHRVEAESVDVVVANPLLCVLDRPLTHCPLAVVDRVPPERRVPVREVRPERAQRLVARADVVVDDVEQHRETLRVRGVDEARETFGTAVRAVRCVRVEPVIAPAALARERRDRHQLDRRDAERAQAVKPRDRRSEGSLFGERPDMELVDDEVVERDAFPACVRPLERAGIDDGRRPSHAVRLRARARVWIRFRAVDDEQVLVAGNSRDTRLADAVGRVRELVPAACEIDRERAHARRPDAQLDLAVPARDGAESPRQRPTA